MVTYIKLFGKWIKQCFSGHFTSIVIGNYNRLFGKERKLYKHRYSICNNCRSNLHVSSIGEICDICGCPLESKLRTPKEHCDLNKW